jgi:hypothetical protein
MEVGLGPNEGCSAKEKKILHPENKAVRSYKTSVNVYHTIRRYILKYNFVTALYSSRTKIVVQCYE